MGEPLDLLALYNAEIDRGPLLSAEEERALFAALPDPAAKAKLITAFLRLTPWVASRYQNRGLDLMDLIQLGNIVLLRLIDKFSPEGNGRFSTYAITHLRYAMLRGLRDYARLVRLPWRQDEALAQAKRLEQQGLSEEALAATLNVEQDELRAWRNADQTPVSIDRVVDEDSTPLADLLADEGEAVADVACRRALLAQLRGALQRLPAEQREILARHYGSGQSLAKIAKAMGQATMPLWRKEQKALAALREAMEMDAYQDPITGQIIDDDCFDDYYSLPVPAVSLVPPAKGDCKSCGNYTQNVKYCRHSGYTIGTNAALKWCAPMAAK